MRETLHGVVELSPRLHSLLRSLRHPRRLARYASLVRQPWEFVLNEVKLPAEPRPYRLAGADLVVYLRHGTPDLRVLRQIFGERVYEPPRAIFERLDDRPRPLRIVDLGANIGLFGLYVLHRFGPAEITAVEPDPANAEVLARCAEANRAFGAWNIVRACASAAPGETAFVVGQFDLSRVAPENTVEPSELVAVVDVFPYLEQADLVKMDIEGAEWAILRDRRLREVGASAIVVEWHEQGAPSGKPRRDAARLLLEAGFDVCDQPHGYVSESRVLWALRRS